MVTPSKQQNLGISVILVYISLVGSVIIAKGQIEWSQPIISIEYKMVHGLNQAAFRT